MTDLSIVIVCHKGWYRLNKCLESLDLFTGKNFRFEVIIVDNKSDDEKIFEAARRFTKFRFIFNTFNGGFANGSNIGAGIAAGEYILFLNPDTVAQEGAVEKLMDIAKQNPDYGIVSCRQINEKGKESNSTGPFPSIFNLTGFQRAIIGRVTPHTSHLTPFITFPDWVSGSVILIRRKLFKKIGGFDEDFWMYFEDVDLCKRIRNIHGEVAFCNDLTIEHNHGGSSRINIKTTSLTKTEVLISRHVYISKHKNGVEKLILQTFLVINNLLSGTIMALLGILLFFIPKVFSRTIMLFRLISYYTGSVAGFSWISSRSVNFRKS